MADNLRLQKFALIAELISAATIVASLIFVGVQVRQSTKVAQVAAYQARVQDASGALVQLALSSEMSAMRLKLRKEGRAALTDLEYDRLQNWNLGTILRGQGQYYQFQMGFLDPASKDGMIKNMAGNYPSWVQLDLVERIEIPEFRREVEAYLEAERSKGSE